MNWKILKLQDIHLLSYLMNQILELKAHTGLHYIDVYGNCDFFDSYGGMPKPDIRRCIDKHTNFGCGYGGIS